MQKIKIFLASSFELKPERDHLETEIYRKCKAWFDRGIFLHLDIWEDMSARMMAGGSQSGYNKYVLDADLFILLGYTKMGMYTAEEFENAIGNFKSTSKPFIFTYFKDTTEPVEDSLIKFKQKLLDMGHFISTFKEPDDLWNQFNKELERLEADGFTKNEHPASVASMNITGDNNKIVAGDEKNTAFNIGTQTADKIVNIGSIENATF